MINFLGGWLIISVICLISILKMIEKTRKLIEKSREIVTDIVEWTTDDNAKFYAEKAERYLHTAIIKMGG